MSATKTCPTCQKQWAATFKFCPEDGTTLAAPPSLVPVAPAVTSASDTVVDVPAVSPAAAARPIAPIAPGPPAALKARKVAPRLLNLEPIVPPATEAVHPNPAPAPQPEEPPKRVKASSRELELRTAPTMLTASVADALVEESRSRAPKRIDASTEPGRPDSKRKQSRPAMPLTRAPDAPLSKRAPAEPSPKPDAPVRTPKEKVGRKKDEFSETAWFMRPNQAVDPETGRVKVDPNAYVRDESIPEEKRRRFSLKRKDEE